MATSLTETATGRIEPAVGPRPQAAWLALALLLAAYTFSWIDRYVFAILLDPIRIDLGIADWQIGLLSGFAFSIAYSVAGFPFARWADQGNRRTVITVALAAWSVITVLCGFAASFAGLFAARAGVAMCEAGCSPAAHSMISDYFPRQRRAAAFAVYSLGVSLGIWLGLWLGGLISAAHGWRAAFVALGLPGLILAVVVRLMLREPPRGRYDAPDRHRPDGYSLGQAIRMIARHRAYLAVIFGLALLSFNGSGIQLWAPTYLLRSGGNGLQTVGAISGAVNGIAGIAGTLLSGFLADRFARHDLRACLWIAAGSALIVVPSQILFLLSHGPITYLFYMIVTFGVSTYVAPLFAAGQMLLPPRLRAFGAAALLFALNMIGTGAGPAAIGALSDALRPVFHEDALRYAMLAPLVSLLPAIALLVYAGRRLVADGHAEVA